MALVVCTSAKGSPGATTTALGLAMAWPDPQRVVVLEADSFGGSLAARWRLGYEPGLLSLAGAGRRGVDAELLLRHTQQLGSVPVLCGPASGDQARAAVAAIAPAIGRAATELDVIVDAGRIGAWSPAADLVRSASATLVVARPVLESVQHVPSIVRTIGDLGGTASLVTVGDKPYVPAEIAEYAECPLAGTLADDARAADILGGIGGSDKALRRSPLWRDLVALGESLVAAVRPRLSDPGVSAQRALDNLADDQDAADIEETVA